MRSQSWTRTECADNCWSLISERGVPPKRHPTPRRSSPEHAQLGSQATSSLSPTVCPYQPADSGHFPGVESHVVWPGVSKGLRFTARLSPPLPCTAEQDSAARADHPLFTPAPAGGRSGQTLGFAGCNGRRSREHARAGSGQVAQ